METKSKSYKESVLGQLEPAAVFSFFEEICHIPHGSGNTERISSYCESFAKDRGLECRRDEIGNVIIRKDGAVGYEDREPVILQGHMDMVCVAEEGYEIDFEKEGLKLRVDGDIISAEGTSLGGDDGIAVAMALALLDSEMIPHPPLEVVLTVDEEVGMLGAAAIDLSDLKGRRLLNLDSEDEGYLLVSCAGGATVTASLPIHPDADSKPVLTGILQVAGLRGGHSGVEIDKGRANACMLLGRALEHLEITAKQAGYRILLGALHGGGKDNAIPDQAQAEFVVSMAQEGDDAAFDLIGHDAASKEREDSLRERLNRTVEECRRIFRSEYAKTEPDMEVKLTLKEAKGEQGKDIKGGAVADASCSGKMISMLRLLPNGIQKMSQDIPGLVQTSLNLGILETVEERLDASFSVRSSLASEKEEMILRIRRLMYELGGSVSVAGDYPAWEYKQDSPLRDLMRKVFIAQYGKEPVMQSIHAGVECGLFAAKLPQMDGVSFGPDMKDIHSPKETMDVASVKRTWEYLLAVLKEM